MPCRARLERREPLRQWYERRWEWAHPRGMKSGGHPAHDACRLVITAAERHLRQRSWTFGTLHQQRIALVGKHARRTISVPPGHRVGAAPLFGFGGDFQHGRHTIAAHGQQAAGSSRDRLAIRLQPPTVKIVLKHCASVHWICILTGRRTNMRYPLAERCAGSTPEARDPRTYRRHGLPCDAACGV